MLAAAAVCPQTPLIVTRMPGLRAVCDAAVEGVLAARPDVLVVVGGATATEAYAGGAAGSLRPWGLDAGAGTGEPVLPLSLTVGRCLLDGLPGGRVPDACQAVAFDAAPAECRALGEKLAARGERVGLLVLADGSACLTPKAPGKYDEAAGPFDDRVAEALGAADPAVLDALDPAEADRLWATGRAALQVLAGAAGGAALRGRLLARTAPYGVGYFTALWD
ncbi:hypothetical protein Nocox_10460 [Nonomuraea coxensis DSM 45129]|uniref:Catalytic LigB subunit of aromatic ring-opening dioxygenase n=1 Tax=Nonomuraea coxensis DSM 45129 TaxID=1122611 RepID=A0ABX8TW50_9ACTN|nr:hypothetical protein [Nonomuraea coxensis]QYC39711.1 hypothetical protein Nocox_10460 [Nonomuraea coxensis DSM 45129]